ncbi:hypothetical protein WA158_003474 [Blastocystis sp. Blastoise]
MSSIVRRNLAYNCDPSKYGAGLNIPDKQEKVKTFKNSYGGGYIEDECDSVSSYSSSESSYSSDSYSSSDSSDSSSVYSSDADDEDTNEDDAKKFIIQAGKLCLHLGLSFVLSLIFKVYINDLWVTGHGTIINAFGRFFSKVISFLGFGGGLNGPNKDVNNASVSLLKDEIDKQRMKPGNEDINSKNVSSDLIAKTIWDPWLPNMYICQDEQPTQPIAHDPLLPNSMINLAPH